MNHQVWNQNLNDPRGIGGDQFMMAISSWRLLYAYTGNDKIKENMSFLAGYYLTHGLSPANCQWPNIPFPYNTLIYSGIYDGDMRNGKDVTQPDKAGSLGLELIHMYKLKGDPKLFLDAAIKIAGTLAAKSEGRGRLPLTPALQGKCVHGANSLAAADGRNGKGFGYGLLYQQPDAHPATIPGPDRALKKGNSAAYSSAFDKILAWLKKYPISDNRWGPSLKT